MPPNNQDTNIPPQAASTDSPLPADSSISSPPPMSQPTPMQPMAYQVYQPHHSLNKKILLIIIFVLVLVAGIVITAVMMSGNDAEQQSSGASEELSTQQQVERTSDSESEDSGSTTTDSDENQSQPTSTQTRIAIGKELRVGPDILLTVVGVVDNFEHPNVRTNEKAVLVETTMTSSGSYSFVVGRSDFSLFAREDQPFQPSFLITNDDMRSAGFEPFQTTTVSPESPNTGYLAFIISDTLAVSDLTFRYARPDIRLPGITTLPPQNFDILLSL
jgi:hypothetical protein